MSPEELIRAGGATLAFDTNAVLGFTTKERRPVFGGFLRMCDDANRLRDEARPSLDISIVIPSLVRMEALHDLRVFLGERPFDTELVKAWLVGKAKVAAFDEDAAIRASGALHSWFSTDEAWQHAKRARCLEALRLAETNPPGKYGLASIDWAIAAQAEAEGWILVTADTFAEFRHVSLKIRKEALRSLLDRLLEERGLSPRRPVRRLRRGAGSGGEVRPSVPKRRSKWLQDLQASKSSCGPREERESSRLRQDDFPVKGVPYEDARSLSIRP